MSGRLGRLIENQPQSTDNSDKRILLKTSCSWLIFTISFFFVRTKRLAFIFLFERLLLPLDTWCCHANKVKIVVNICTPFLKDLSKNDQFFNNFNFLFILPFFSISSKFNFLVINLIFDSVWNLQRYAKFNWSIEYSPSHGFNVRYLYAEKKLLKSCYKALDWWVYGLDRMASSADDWRSKSVNRSSWKVEPSSLHRWIFDQLSWHNQLQHLIMNRTWWQIIFWALDCYLQPFLWDPFVFTFISSKFK